MNTIPAVSVEVTPLCVLCQERPGTIQPHDAGTRQLVCTTCQLDLPTNLTDHTDHAPKHDE